MMKKPPHPGGIVRDQIEELGLTITDAAKSLGVSRQTLNNLVNEGANISPEMAIRLETVVGSNAEFWLRLQSSYDLAKINERRAEITAGLRRLEPAQ